MSKSTSKSWWGARGWRRWSVWRSPHGSRRGPDTRRQQGAAIPVRWAHDTAAVQDPTNAPRTRADHLRCFLAEQWTVVSNVRDRRSLAASLTAGDLPLEIQTAFSKAKLRFMPERYVDLHLECACPTGSSPAVTGGRVAEVRRRFRAQSVAAVQLRGWSARNCSTLCVAAPNPFRSEPEAEDCNRGIDPVKLEPLPADPKPTGPSGVSSSCPNRATAPAGR